MRSDGRSPRFLRAPNHHSVVGPMGKVASCGDDAATESFFSQAQKTMLDGRSWRTREHRRTAIMT